MKAKMLTVALLVAAMMSVSVSASAQSRRCVVKGRKGNVEKVIIIRNGNKTQIIKFQDARFGARRCPDARFFREQRPCKHRRHMHRR